MLSKRFSFLTSKLKRGLVKTLLNLYQTFYKRIEPVIQTFRTLQSFVAQQRRNLKECKKMIINFA